MCRPFKNILKEILLGEDAALTLNQVQGKGKPLGGGHFLKLLLHLWIVFGRIIGIQFELICREQPAFLSQTEALETSGENASSVFTRLVLWTSVKSEEFKLSEPIE